MFAINHAASALLFKKHIKSEVSLIWILISVQFVEFVWVLLNLMEIEKTTTESVVNYVGDIHLEYMPFSHSVLTSFLLALAVGFIFFFWKNFKTACIMALAVLSHIILDIFTHAPDIPLGYANSTILGFGLYSSWPVLAYFIELTFGIFCWWYYGGNKTLFWIILLFNLANLTMFIPGIKGLEFFMANKPILITVVILFQIILTLTLVVWAVKKKTEPLKKIHPEFS